MPVQLDFIVRGFAAAAQRDPALRERQPYKAAHEAATLESFDDGPQKPLHIWARTRRRPAIACGNSTGDLEMLRFAGGASKPALGLVVAHQVVAHHDPVREVDDRGGADNVLGAGFTEISMLDDSATVFAD